LLPRGHDYLGLHVLADDDPRWGRSPVDQSRDACAAGVPVIQLRTKHATDAQTLEWAHAIRGITRDAGARFVVNDRFDIALLSEADAVHLGQGDLPPAAIPEEVREKLAIGRSTHTPEQLKASCQEPVDYVAFGPVFGTKSKDSDYSERGLDALRKAVELAAPRPLIAIGGIHAEHLPLLSKAGVGGFAVISVVAGADDPVASARALVDSFAESSR
jgi:thiamine-phosphate pyrophosphorylase